MNNKKIKYWISAFDKTEENKGNSKLPKFRLLLKHPETKEEWEGALFLKRSKSGTLYLSGEIRENDTVLPDDDFDLQKMYEDDLKDSDSDTSVKDPFSS